MRHKYTLRQGSGHTLTLLSIEVEIGEGKDGRYVAEVYQGKSLKTDGKGFLASEKAKSKKEALDEFIQDLKRQGYTVVDDEGVYFT